LKHKILKHLFWVLPTEIDAFFIGVMQLL